MYEEAGSWAGAYRVASPRLSWRTSPLLNRTVVFATLLAITLVATMMLATPRTSHAAPPSDGVYDIAVLEVGDYTNWEESLFDQFSGSEYEWEFIGTGDLTSSDLDQYDVLVIPWSHDYDWLTPQMAAAIMNFVEDGGTLLIHSVVVNECEGICEAALPDGVPDALLAFFPSAYSVDWSTTRQGGDDEHVLIINPNHPLASQPNTLTEEGLSGWGDSFHSFVVAYGSAWQWVLATDFEEVDEEETDVSSSPARASQSGNELTTQDIEPGVDMAMIQGCAPLGAGVIVVSGQDPEYHGRPNSDDEIEARMQIENEVKIGARGCGSVLREDDRNQRPPNIGAGLSGLFNGMPTPLPTAPSAVAPAATAPTISPPRTGDGGLVSTSEASVLGLFAAGFVLTLLSVHRFARR
jgi:hypothetical protein